MAVFVLVGGRAPYGEGVVDVAAVEWEESTKCVDEVEFIDGVVECCVDRCWWGTRSSFVFLASEGVAKLEDVMAHEDSKGASNIISARC